MCSDAVECREREREMERVGGCREPVLCRIGPWLFAWRAFVPGLAMPVTPGIAAQYAAETQ